MRTFVCHAFSESRHTIGCHLVKPTQQHDEKQRERSVEVSRKNKRRRIHQQQNLSIIEIALQLLLPLTHYCSSPVKTSLHLKITAASINSFPTSKLSYHTFAFQQTTTNSMFRNLLIFALFASGVLAVPFDTTYPPLFGVLRCVLVAGV